MAVLLPLPSLAFAASSIGRQFVQQLQRRIRRTLLLLRCYIKSAKRANQELEGIVRGATISSSSLSSSTRYDCERTNSHYGMSCLLGRFLPSASLSVCHGLVLHTLTYSSPSWPSASVLQAVSGRQAAVEAAIELTGLVFCLWRRVLASHMATEAHC